MPEDSATTHFDLTGIFGGFVFTEAGKRRLLLQTDEGQEFLIKVPRLLRRKFIGKVHRGGRVRIVGTVEAKEDTDEEIKRTATRLRPVWPETTDPAAANPAIDPNASSAQRVAVPTDPPATAKPPAVPLLPAVLRSIADPIRVCAKKNCWRAGGRELWEALQREVGARGLRDQVTLKKVGCLDRCNRAPNVDWGDHEFSRCRLGDAAAIVARVVEEAGLQTTHPDAA